MKKRQLQVIVIFFFSIIFCLISSATFAQTSSPQSAQPNAFIDKEFLQNVAITAISAVLSFLGGYALAGISKGSGSSKRLSYNLDIETGLVNIENNIKERVLILYEGKEIVNLSNVKVDIENTGSSIVKLEDVRFEFPEGTQILE